MDPHKYSRVYIFFQDQQPYRKLSALAGLPREDYRWILLIHVEQQILKGSNLEYQVYFWEESH